MQYPGPDGVRPGELAERAGISKQAMNQLLKSLERLGYIAREDAPDEGRARSSALPNAAKLRTRRCSTSFATSSRNGAPNWGRSDSPN